MDKDAPKAVIEDFESFKVFLASQPLCQWAAEKQRRIDSERLSLHSPSSIHPPPQKNDNADLAAALAALA
jgi:hypothetical protein